MQRYFKLETYIGKLVMSYLNTYVKLRDDQVATSLWEGDVILTHLELRCDSLDHLLPYSLSFRSGQVHELRIHIPWTKLHSESIVVTLNTVECILALKHSTRQTTTGPSEQSVSDSTALSATECQQLASTESPGYLESYMNRLISNVRFVVQNLNIKFLQDDIVLSMSSNRVEFFPTDMQWQPSYQLDQSGANFMIHRKLQIFDITLCLDQAGPSGFVDTYEEPIVYRFNLSCLVESVFSGDSKSTGAASATTPLVTAVNVYTERLDCHISPAQLRALIRLQDIFTAIHTETVNWSTVGPYTQPGAADSVEDINAQRVEQPGGDLIEQSVESEQLDSQSQGSWASWVWSFVSSLSPPNVESSEDESDEVADEELLRYPRRSAAELFRLVYEDAERQLRDDLLHISRSPSENSISTIPNIHAVEMGHSKSFDSLEKVEELKKSLDIDQVKQKRRRIRALKKNLGHISLTSVGVFIDHLVVQVKVSFYLILSFYPMQLAGYHWLLTTPNVTVVYDAGLFFELRCLQLNLNFTQLSSSTVYSCSLG